MARNDMTFVDRIEIAFTNPHEQMKGADVTYVDGSLDEETGKWFPQRTYQQVLAEGPEMSPQLEQLLDKARVDAIRRVGVLEHALLQIASERDAAVAFKVAAEAAMVRMQESIDQFAQKSFDLQKQVGEQMEQIRALQKQVADLPENDPLQGERPPRERIAPGETPPSE